MKTQILSYILIFFSLSSCSTFQAGSGYTYKFKLISENASDEKTFEDDLLKIEFEYNQTNLGFILENKSDYPMKISWDEVSLVLFGETKRVIHKGIKLVDRDAPQASTVVPSHASLVDFVTPAENIYFDDGNYYTVKLPPSWKQSMLFLDRDLGRPHVREAILESKGQTFRLFLPLEYNGERLNYNFEFLIEDVIPNKENKKRKPPLN